MTGLIFALALISSPPGETTPADRLALARVIYAEAGPTARRDWGPIAWALWRRKQAHEGRSLAWVARHYSSPLKPALASRARLEQARESGNDREVRAVYRRRFVQALGIGKFPIRKLRKAYPTARPSRARASWEAVRGFVELWAMGAIADRCPRAEHWDQRGRPVRPGMVRVKCPGTANAFFRYDPQAFRASQKVVDDKARYLF